MASFTRQLAAEAIGSILLFVCVIGSGIMAERLAGGNGAVALLANAIATGAILFVLIAMLAPVSGAHFNPAVTLVMAARGELSVARAGGYFVVQIGAALIAPAIAHGMFDLPLLQVSHHVRDGAGQWLGEFIASFGLVFVILGTARHRPDSIPASVALYIVAAYWFTSSTSFANPAITLARCFTDTFSGIAPQSVPGFIAAQFVGAAAGAAVGSAIFSPSGSEGD